MKIAIIEDEVGITNFLKQGLEEEHYEVLTANDNALSTELELINNKYNQMNAVIDLYKALGGGY